MITTKNRIRILGIVLIAVGTAVALAGFAYGMPQANDGLDAAQAMYAAQGVELAYNEQGQLLDRGTPEGAQRIMDLLVNDWKYPVNAADFDPNDPVVDTRSELMYQYAVISYHVMHTEVDVVLTAEQVPITYRGVTYTEAGTYKIAPLDYYANFDRTHAIEGQLRAAWNPLALALVSGLAGGHANQAAGELAQATSFGFGGIGLLFVLGGAGLVWVSYGRDAPVRSRSAASAGAVIGILRE